MQTSREYLLYLWEAYSRLPAVARTPEMLASPPAAGPSGPCPPAALSGPLAGPPLRSAEKVLVREVQRQWLTVVVQRQAEPQRRAEPQRQAEPQRWAESQRRAEEAQRWAEAERRAVTQRRAEAERWAASQRWAEAERWAVSQRWAEAERWAGPAA